MKLIYIRSTMEPKNYSTIRSILKKEQGEKIAPYIFKINDTQTLESYLRKERITYEIYQEERKIINVRKRKQNENVLLLNKKQKQELLDKVKGLEERIKQLEEENRKLKDQQNGQLTAQIEVKETKR